MHCPFSPTPDLLIRRDNTTLFMQQIVFKQIVFKQIVSKEILVSADEQMGAIV